MNDLQSDILIAAFAAMLLQALGHYLPWRGLLGKPLPKVSAYVYGTLGIGLPLSWALARNGFLEALAMLWVVIGASGTAVWICYEVDGWIEMRHRLIEARERVELERRLHDER